MLESVQNQHFIDGIDAYCDRWCERCPLTERCRFASQERLRNARHRAAGEDPDSWDVIVADIGQSLSEAMTMIQEDADNLGIDLDTDVDEMEGQAIWDRAIKHPLHLAALQYAQETHQFLLQYGHTDLTDLGLENAVETISWYHTQIPAKIFRAICDCGPDEVEGSDADGSAKVAHIGLTSSLKAFSKLQKSRAWLQKEIMSLMLGVCDLIEGINRDFPGHWAFKRPGFDD